MEASESDDAAFDRDLKLAMALSLQAAPHAGYVVSDDSSDAPDIVEVATNHLDADNQRCAGDVAFKQEDADAEYAKALQAEFDRAADLARSPGVIHASARNVGDCRGRDPSVNQRDAGLPSTQL